LHPLSIVSFGKLERARRPPSLGIVRSRLPRSLEQPHQRHVDITTISSHASDANDASIPRNAHTSNAWNANDAHDAWNAKRGQLANVSSSRNTRNCSAARFTTVSWRRANVPPTWCAQDETEQDEATSTSSTHNAAENTVHSQLERKYPVGRCVLTELANWFSGQE